MIALVVAVLIQDAAPTVLAPTPATEHYDWAALPSADDIARFYPQEASNRHMSGEARVGCRATAVGTLVDCKVVDESPPGAGFGDATIQAAQFFRLKPQRPDGSSMEGAYVMIPMRWHAPE